jgi:hypothetical protein
MRNQVLLPIAIVSLSLLCMPPWCAGKDKGKHDDVAQDRIDILANLAIEGGPVARFTVTRHYSRSYLYLEHTSHSLTLVDITDPNHPSLVSKLNLPANEAGPILAAAGDAALVSAAPVAADAPRTTTMSIVSFADHGNPRTLKQFNRVTCSALDNPRGLIFIANDDGLWILHRNPAEDPEVQERYAHDVLYNR